MNNLIITIALLLNMHILAAQPTFVGTWEGKLNVGVDLRIAFTISKDANNNITALLDCPDQGLKDVKTNAVVMTDSIVIDIRQFKASYSGKLKNDNTIVGTFNQGASFPLSLKKVEKITETIRPQTPVPPFQYKVEELTYSNPDGSVTYGATLTIPGGKGPFPAALLLTGSGQQNRDEEIGGHKPFAVIADHLTRNGFVVLRVDDRGMGKTTGDFRSATTRDFADDANVSLDFLKKRPEVNPKKIGLIGHSEGGMIAQILAAERKDIDFVVMLAAPGTHNRKLLADQNEAILTKAGLPREHVEAYLILYNNILEIAASSPGNVLGENINKSLDKWISETPESIVKGTTGITDDKSRARFVKAFTDQIGFPWFTYFVNYDPARNVQKIKANVLALNGGEDLQVLADPNLAAIESALKKSKSRHFEVTKIDGLNHLFQECQSCTLAEYTKLDQTISPKVLEAMTTWLRTHSVSQN